jgi:hypothetical protein
MKEAYPLQWPQGWKRTRPGDQKTNGQWKMEVREAQDGLLKELERMKASSVIVSTNVPVGLKGQLVSGTSVRDPGVAVYFSIVTEADFSWMDVLKIDNPYPTLEEVQAAYKPLAIKYHPEAPGGDAETFKMLSEALGKAKAWVAQREKQEHQHVIACDQYKEVRWNINAIRLSLAAMRAIDRYGVTGILERVFKGFEQLPENANATAPART